MPAPSDYEWPPPTLHERITLPFCRTYHWFDWRVRDLRCLLTRHVVCDNYGFAPDWCRRCGRNNPDEKPTLWDAVHWRFVWLMEHSKLFYRFDGWLLNSKLSQWLPSWCEY